MRIGIIGSCIVGSGNRQTAACSNGQGAGFIGNLVVALNLLAGGGDSVAAHGLAGYAADGVGDLVAVQGTGNRRGQLGIGFAVYLALVIGSDGNGGGGHGQSVGVFCGLIVGVGGTNLHGHGANVRNLGNFGGPFAAVHLILDGSTFGHAGSCRLAVLVGIIGSGIVGSGNCQTAACGNGQGAGFISNLVVALNFRSGRGDGVAAHVLTGVTAQGVGNLVAIQRAGNRRGQLGIGRTEHLGLVIGSDSYSGRIDGQLSVRCLGYDVLTGSIHRVHGAVGKLRIIGARVGAGGGDGNTGEVHASGSTGVAFHSLLGAVIGPGLAVGGQLYILIVVEVDHIAGGLDRNSFAGGGGNGIARNFNGEFGPRFAKSPVMQFLGRSCLYSGSIPVVVYDRIQIGAFGVVQVDNVLVGSNGQGFLIGAVVVITIDCNDFLGSRYGGSEGHAILYLLSMQDVAGVLLQIVHRIAQVGADGEGAGDGHVLVGHGEIRLAPAGEGIAGCGGRGSHGHAFAVLVGCIGGQGSGVCGTRADVLVGHGVAVPGVVQLQNQTAVTGNGAALHGSFYRLVEGESGNALFFSRHDRAGGTAAGHRCFQLVSTVQIFQIVLYLVGSIAVRSVGDNDYFIVIRHVAVNSRLIHRVTGNNRRHHVIAFVVVQFLDIVICSCTASLIHVANGQGVAVNREATRNCNIIRRHLEGAIPIPTTEGIARGGGIRFYGHIRAVLIADRFWQFTCALGCSAIVIRNRVGIPVVLNFNHSTSIGRNCLLPEGLGCKTIVLFCLSGSLCTGDAFLSFMLVLCISGAIQIFPQMHHGIFGVRCGFPLSDIDHGAGNGFGNLRVPALEGIAGTDRISPEQRGCIPVVQIVMNLILKDFLAVHTVGVSHGVVDVSPGVSCHVGNITHALAVIQRGTVFLCPTGKLIGKRRISRAGRIGRDGHRITVVIGFLADLGSVIVLIKDGVVDGLPFAGQGHVLGRHGKGAVGRNRYIIRSPALEGIAGSSSGRSHSDRRIILTVLLSGQGAGTGRGRSVVVGHLVAVCPVGNRYGYVLSGHGAGDNFHIRGIACDAGRRNIIVLFKVHGLGVGCCCLTAVLIYIIDGQIEGRFLPLGGEGHVVGGHGEGVAGNCHIIRSPALEGIAGLGGNIGNDVHNGAFVLPVRVALIPAAAVQVIGHEVARHVLGVEGGIRVQGIGEGHLAAGAGLVGVPAVEGVGHAVSSGFGCGQIGNGRELAGSGGSARLVVLGGLLHVAGITRVPQLVHCGVNTLRPDFHGAVHVLIGVGGVISGNLEGMDMDVLHVIFRNGHAKVRFHFGLVGVEDSGPMGTTPGDIAALKPGRPADDTAGNAVAVLVAVLPLGAVHIDGTGTQRSAPTGGIGFGISIGVNQVIEQRLVRRAFRGSYGDLVGRCNSRSARGGHRIADFRLAGSHCGHVAVLVHGENFLAAALPLTTDHVRIGGLNGGSQLGSGVGESGHGIRTGQGHGSDRHRLTDNLHSIDSGNIGNGIGHRDLRFTNLQAGHLTRLGQGDHILICGAPLEIRFRTGGSQLGGQLSGDAYEKVVSAGNGNPSEGRDNNSYGCGFVCYSMGTDIMPSFAIFMGNRNRTSRQTGQGRRRTGAADGCLGRIVYSPCSLIRARCIAAAIQSNCLALVNCSIGKGDGIGAGTGLGQGVGIAGQQVADLLDQGLVLLGLIHGGLGRFGLPGRRVRHCLGGLLRVFRGGLGGGHVDDPGLHGAVRGIGHGGRALGHAVDGGVQGIALGGGDGGSGEVIAAPAAALGKARGQNDGTAHGHTPIRIFLAFGQSSLGQSLLGLGRLRFLLRFRRNRVRGGSLLRRAAGLRHRRLGDHGLRFGHFRSGAVDREGAGGAERHDHAQSQESCNQSSLHGDVAPWIIYVKLTILYGNNGRWGRPFSRCTRSLYHAEL